MRIVVISHLNATENDYGFYLSDLIAEYAAWLGYDVQLLEDFLFYNKKSLAENAVIGIHVKATSALRVGWWYRAQLPAVLAQVQAHAVINLTGIYCKATKVPQLLAFTDVTFLQNSKKAKAAWQKLVAKNAAAWLQSAAASVTYSQHAARVLQENAGGQKQITVLPFSGNKDYKVWEWHDKVLTKSEFTSGKEYFICILDDKDEDLWLTLLKAFSKFKKWQQSTMQLILVPKHDIVPLNIVVKLGNYKYRDDVQTLEGLTEKEKANLFGCAYTVIHIPQTDADLQPVADALQCGVPVITTATSASLAEYGNNTGISVASAEAELLGDAIITMFKNEELKTQMADNAKNQAEEIKRDDLAKTFWELVEKTANS